MAKANQKYDEQLLTAYLDGELDSEHRAKAELLIRENAQYARLVEDWKENGNVLRRLPKYELGKRFSDRVLAACENAQLETPQAASRESTSDVQVPRMSPAPSGQTSPMNGLVAIAFLAAMVLLTLFVFPAFVEQPRLAQADPVVGSDQVATENSDAANPENTKQGDNPVIQRVERNKMLSAPGPASVVDPIHTFNSNLPVVEQVFWVKLDMADQSLAGLQKILADNAIRIVDSERDFSQTDDVSAIYVVASSLQMQKAFGNLSHQSSARVTAFPLPLSKIQSGKAQQVSPINLVGDAQQATEIAELERWFGLAGDEDEARPVRFLLLVSGN